MVIPVSAALGMAGSYYGYPFLVSLSWGLYLLLGILFFLALLVCFIRVLRFFPLWEKIPPLVYRAGRIALAASVGFSLGIASRQHVPGAAEFGIPFEEVIAVRGILSEDPRTLQSGFGLGSLELLESAGQDGIRATARGNLTVFFPAESIPRLKEFGRGCEVFADGVISQGSRGFLFRATSLHIVKPAPAPEQLRTGLRMTLLEKFQTRGRGQQAPVWAGLASALLLGVREDLDMSLAEDFKNSGCSHILALSGMHLAILSCLLTFLLRRPLGIRWACLLGGIFIVFYVFIAGSQPSLGRAAIMYLMGCLALWGMLQSKPLSLLCMAFIIQILFYGKTGTSVSFILSYLALFGILTLGLTFHSLFRGRLPEIISGGLSASLGAFILTAPVVVLFFGTLRPIGIVASLVIAPLSSLFMVLALAALISSFLPLPLWNVFDFVLGWFYRFLELIISLAGRVPGLNLSSPLPVLAAVIILWILALFVKRQDMLYRNNIASFS